MKKIILGLFTLMSISAFGLNVNIGVNGNQGTFYKIDQDVIPPKLVEKDFDGITYGVQLEVTQGFIIGDLGVGASYEPNYKLKGDSRELTQMPVYIIGRINLFPILVKPYFAAKVGKTFYSGDLSDDFDKDNGYYYAAALGLTLIDMLQAEASYSFRTVEIDSDTQTSGIMSLSLSYNLF